MVAPRTALAMFVMAATPVASAHPAAMHSLHTSLAALTHDAASQTLTVSLRVFVDDFASAVIRARPAADGAPVVVPPDSAMFRYVVRRFTIADAAGRPVPLRWCGARRAGEVIFVCLRAPMVGNPTGARVRSAVLTELFTDQVNIVQASYGGRRRTLLFTPSDGAKVLQ